MSSPIGRHNRGFGRPLGKQLELRTPSESWRQAGGANASFQQGGRSLTSEVAVAFVGTVVPDEPRYHTTAFNRAGNNFQYQLVRGFAREGILDVEIFSARPIPSFPRNSTIWVPARREHFGDLPVQLLP